MLTALAAVIGAVAGFAVHQGRKEKREPPSDPARGDLDHEFASLHRKLSAIERRGQYMRDLLVRIDTRLDSVFRRRD